MNRSAYRQKNSNNEEDHDIRRLVIYLLPVLIMAFIFVQSALPAYLSSEESGIFADLICRLVHADPELVTFFVRKAAHFTEYLVLGASLLAAVQTRQRKRKQAGNPEMIILAEMIGAAYAVSDEIHQAFVPGRSCELRDILIDAAGVFCGILLMRLYYQKAAGKTGNESEK